MADEFPLVPLGQVASVRSGFAFKSSDWTPGGAPVVKIANVKNGRLNMEGCSFVNAQVAAEASEFQLIPNDILIAMTGYIGDVAWVYDHDLPALLNQRVGRFSIHDEQRLHRRFLFYLLRSPGIRSEIEGLGYGSAQPNVSPSLIHSVNVPLPSLIDQQAITCILGALDDKIELNRRLNETLEQIAQAIFKSWFIDPTVDGLPEGWRYVPVSELCDINAWSLSKADDLDEIHYIEISEVSRGNIANVQVFQRGMEPSRARRRLRHGDTVLSTVRPGRGSYFLCLNPPPNIIASTGFAVLTPTKAPWSFVHAAVTTQEVFEHLGQQADGGAYPAIRPDVVGKWKVARPHADAQMERFHRVCGSLYERTDNIRRESRILSGLRDTLLPKLISGELRVPDAEKIVGRCA